MARARYYLRGFTLFETLLTIAIFSAIAAWFARVASTSAGLSADSAVMLRAQEEHRRNLRSLADAVRGAAYSSLSGFAADGTSTAPSFAVVKSFVSGATVLDTPMQWSWRATTAPVNGVSKPGEIVCVQGAVTKRVATRVPFGGFKVILAGGTLKIQLTTYYATSQGKTVTLSGETTVSLRN